jgi:hypothetical protein
MLERRALRRCSRPGSSSRRSGRVRRPSRRGIRTRLSSQACTQVAGGHPGALLASAKLTSPTAGAWNDVSIPSTAIAEGQSYWIALLGIGGVLYLQDQCCGAEGAQPAETSRSTSPSSPPTAWSTGTVYPHDRPRNRVRPAPRVLVGVGDTRCGCETSRLASASQFSKARKSLGRSTVLLLTAAAARDQEVGVCVLVRAGRRPFRSAQEAAPSEVGLG